MGISCHYMNRRYMQSQNNSVTLNTKIIQFAKVRKIFSLSIIAEKN